MEDQKGSDTFISKWLTSEKLLLWACSLLVGLGSLVVMVSGSLIGIWTSKIEHTVTRVDGHDQRLTTHDSRLTIQEHDTKRILEILADREPRLRELERAVGRTHK